MTTTPVELISALSTWRQVTDTSDLADVPSPADTSSALAFSATSPDPLGERLSHQVPLTPAVTTRLAELLVRDVSRQYAERLAAALHDRIDAAFQALPDPYGVQAPDAEHLPLLVIYDIAGRDAPDASGTSIWSHALTEPIAAALTSMLRGQLRGPFLLPDNVCWCDECDNRAYSGFCALASLLHSPIFSRPCIGDQARIGMSVMLPPCTHEGAPMWQFSDHTARWFTHLLTSR